MKKFVMLFVAVAFFATVALMGCGPTQEPPKPAPKEEAKPAAPAPEKAAPEKPAAAPEKPAGAVEKVEKAAGAVKDAAGAVKEAVPGKK
jgi:hypothetical protein